MKGVNVKGDQFIRTARLMLSVCFAIFLSLPAFEFPLFFMFFLPTFLFNYLFLYNHRLFKKVFQREISFYILLLELSLFNAAFGYLSWYMSTSANKYQLLIAIFGAIGGFIYGLISCIAILIMRKLGCSQK